MRVQLDYANLAPTSRTVAVPDARAAHTGGKGLYVQVERAWGWAPLAQVLLPRYVPRAGKETLLHLSFWARCEKLHAADPTPSVQVAFLDLHKNYEQLGLQQRGRATLEPLLARWSKLDPPPKALPRLQAWPDPVDEHP